MSKIKSYNDLLREEQGMKELLKAQKELVICDLEQIKEEIKPVAATLRFIRQITTKDQNNPLLNEGISKVVDFLLKKVVLARSGWMSKLIFPFFVKNYSSHLVADHKEEIVGKLFSLIRHNGKDKTDRELPGSN